MKNENGITLIALIIYVILITFVIAGISTITMSFYTNLNVSDSTSRSAVSFTKFNMYFIKDIKSDNVEIRSVSNDKIDLAFTNSEGHSESASYYVQNNILYRNKVKICEDIREVAISGSGQEVTVYLKIGNYTKRTTYALEPGTSGPTTVSV